MIENRENALSNDSWNHAAQGSEEHNSWKRWESEFGPSEWRADDTTSAEPQVWLHVLKDHSVMLNAVQDMGRVALGKHYLRQWSKPRPSLTSEGNTSSAKVENSNAFIDDYLLSVDHQQRDRVRLDIEYVFNRLTRFMNERQAKIWLKSHNGNLGGRPIDAIVGAGTSDVIVAVDAQEALAY